MAVVDLFKKRTSEVPLVRLGRPETHTEWVDRYQWCNDWYTGQPYTPEEIKALNLFRILDDKSTTATRTMAATRRVNHDVRHVVETDVRALAPRWRLEVAPRATQRLLQAGEGVWRRSRIRAEKGRWMRLLTSMGAQVIEAMRMEDGRTQLVAHDARNCEVEYDHTGANLFRVTVTEKTMEDGVLHVYKRVLTADGIVATHNGEHIERWSGPHGLGVVPAVHLTAIPYDEPEYGLCAFHGLWEMAAVLDSIVSQINAIGKRYAHPLHVMKGATIGTEDDVAQMGRWLTNLPPDAAVDLLEPTMAGVQMLLETFNALRSAAREAIPEFIMGGAGANTSGEAARFWATAFVAKAEEMRERIHGDIALVTQYAAEMDLGRKHDPDRAELLQIAAPPALPADQTTETTAPAARRARARPPTPDGLPALGYTGRDAGPASYAARLAGEAEATEDDPTEG